MNQFAIGTKVYYTGDMANPSGSFTVTALRNGTSYDLREDDGERIFRGVMHIASTYNGTCSERFVTEAARDEHRNARFKEMELAANERVRRTMHEQAEALGFASIEQMEEHQRWLNEQARYAELVSAELARAKATGTPINLRKLA